MKKLSKIKIELELTPEEYHELKYALWEIPYLRDTYKKVHWDQLNMFSVKKSPKPQRSKKTMLHKIQKEVERQGDPQWKLWIDRLRARAQRALARNRNASVPQSAEGAGLNPV